jgi:signal transduction histidine kinase
MLDDLHIQSNTLELHLKHCNLAALLREAFANRQRTDPARTMVLSITPAGHVVPILADADHISQVIDSYLAHAFSSSSLDQPVTVQLTAEDARTRVWVHDERPGIPEEEQGRVWQPFSYARRISGQGELDSSLGSGYYLRRAFIERHPGNVGVQSNPGHSATFCFTLPLAIEEI